MSEIQELLADQEFCSMIKDLLENEMVLELKKFNQHHRYSRFDHSVSVAYYTYKMCLKWHVEPKEIVRAALLHDLFIYDWRVEKSEFGSHAFAHPKEACINAEKIMPLTDMQKNCILSHMFPLSKTMPRYKGSWIIQAADKYSAIQEYSQQYKKVLTSNQKYRKVLGIFSHIYHI
ncbi:MAG: HD domain-containing protein [Erysipelotrichaceae bacterium]|nr:HD domain-containing protein [Erysipelotrichaceae bacterium]